MIYSQKIRIRPNKELENRFINMCNASRFVYNFLLAYTLQKDTYGIKYVNDACAAFRGKMKNKSFCDKNGEAYPDKFYEFLSSLVSQNVDMETENLKRAWKSIKKGSKPLFKKRTNPRNSFTIHRKNKSNFKVVNNILHIMKLPLFNIDKLRFRFKDPSNDCKLVTVRKSPMGWYVSLTYEIPDDSFDNLINFTGKSIGIDWGVSKFATDSDRNYCNFKEHEGYKNYLKTESKLKRLQRKLSKLRLKNSKYYDSKRYLKLKLKVGRLYERLSNIRKNFIHLVSKLYIDEYDDIVIEDLKPSNMLKNHKLSRSIAESMFYTWKITLQYKCKFYKKRLHIVNPRDTSQTCSSCNVKLVAKLKLSNRVFKCECCGFKEDRDVNAAINILKKANI